MINIHNLEKKWLKYKIKSYMPHIVLTSTLIIISLIYISPLEISKSIESIKNSITNVNNTEKHFSTNSEIKKIKTDNNISTVNIQTSKKIISNQKESLSNDKKILSPSLGFIDNIKDKTPKYYKEETTKKRIYNKKPKIEKKKITEKKEVKKIIKKIEKKAITIKRKNNQDDINHVIKRFNTNNSPQLSLFISKKYYEMKEYKKAYNYALMTNKIDKNIDASWLIFAKSLIKLGKRDMAIKVLRQYIKQSKSDQAKVLLNDIRSGKFK